MTANAYSTKKRAPDLVVKCYSDAGYFGRNLPAIEVLIDQEKVQAGVGLTASALLKAKATCCGRRWTTVSLAPESLLNRLASVLTAASPTPL